MYLTLKKPLIPEALVPEFFLLLMPVNLRINSANLLINVKTRIPQSREHLRIPLMDDAGHFPMFETFTLLIYFGPISNSGIS